MKKYSIQVESRDGAKQGYVGTRAEIDHYLSGWADPENLIATISDEHGKLLFEKPFGKSKIKWTNTTHIKLAFDGMFEDPKPTMIYRGKLSSGEYELPIEADTCLDTIAAFVSAALGYKVEVKNGNE